MSTLVTLAALAMLAGAAAWIAFALRKYKARKAFEHQREAQFVAEMLRAKPAATAAAVPAPAAPAALAPAASAPATAAPAPAAPATAPTATDPLSAVANNIRNMLAAGRAADAAKAFLDVVAERNKLTLEPPVWESLGRALLAQGAFMESAWALHAGAALAGDVPGAQKRLVEVANKAGDAGQAQHALKLYQTLLAKYPQSQYADFVRANMKEQERKLKG